MGASLLALAKSIYYFNRYKTNQLTGNVYNDSEITVSVKDLAMQSTFSCYRKDKHVIVSLVLLGLHY